VLQRNRYHRTLGLVGIIAMVSLLSKQAVASDDWSPEGFDYDRPIRLDIRDDPQELTNRVVGTRQQQVIFKDRAGDDVPVLITLPGKGRGPFPVVVLVHGFSSHKQQVTRQLGRALTDRGFACLAPDMPYHGHRPGPPQKLFTTTQPSQARDNIVQAIQDIRQTIDLAEARRELRASKGVGLIGYSMGAWFGTLAGASERRIKAMVLMVGGSAAVDASKEPKTANQNDAEQLDLFRRFVAIRPLEAIGEFAPRPLLMQNGKQDSLVPIDQAKALYDAARKPKEHRWYDASHLLNRKACQEAADWLATQMNPKNKN